MRTEPTLKPFEESGATSPPRLVQTLAGDRGARRVSRLGRVCLAVVLLATLAGLIRGSVAQASLPPLQGRIASIAPLDQVRAVAHQQEQALVRRDQSGWLAAVDPTNRTVRRVFADRYTLLTAMGVTSMQVRVDDAPLGGADAATPGVGMRTRIGYSYCAQLNPCPSGLSRESFDAIAVWERRAQGYVITDYTPLASSYRAFPLPWLNRPTVALKGPRVTVLAPEGERSEMSAVLDNAVAGTTRIDSYALDPAPTRYIIYLAGPDEWSSMYGDLNAVGIAQNTSASSMVVILNMKYRPADDPRSLWHEMGHVATLLGRHVYEDQSAKLLNQFWIEGLADLVAWGDQAAYYYNALQYGQAFVQSGDFTGDLDDYQTWSGPGEHNRFYAIAYLTWRCVEEQFGRSKVIELATKLFDPATLSNDEATRTVLGQPWDAVERTCVAYIRNILG